MRPVTIILLSRVTARTQGFNARRHVFVIFFFFSMKRKYIEKVEAVEVEAVKVKAFRKSKKGPRRRPQPADSAPTAVG
jgi:hypothetical protein